MNRKPTLTWPTALFAALLLSSFILRPSSFAQSPSQQLIPFQGRLTNQQGTAYNSGQYSITFNLYSVAVGGSTVWTERHEKVGVVNGMVNVFLGSINAIGAVDFSTTKYLGITVDVDNNAATADPEMVPRQMIIPAFWAKQADNSTKMAGKDWTTIIVDGSNVASNDPTTGFLKGSKLSAGSITGTQLATNLTLGGTTTINQLSLPSTINASNGVLSIGGSPFLYAYGSGNVFLGTSSGNFSMSGINNTGTGVNTLVSNTTGSSNTGSGVSALASNTTGSGNTAAGQNALYNNTTGVNNTANGSAALFNNTTGISNIAYGVNALNATTTGQYNIALGLSAGGNLVGGNSNNIDIGNGGVAGDNAIIRIGNPGTQSDTYLTGAVHSSFGFACRPGTGGAESGHIFNFQWTGTALSAYVDSLFVGTVALTSDRRLKEKINPLHDQALARVMSLKPVSFQYKNVPGTVFTGSLEINEGFIADELQAVIPSAVVGQKDGLTKNGEIQPQTVNIVPVVSVVTKAVQELAHRLEAKDTQITKLATENAAMEQRLAALEVRDKEREARVARMESLAPVAPSEAALKTGARNGN